MAGRLDPKKTNFRNEAKEYYRNKQNIAAKWLDQYGNVNREDDYQRNRSCLSEVFNMLDVVMDNCIDDFRHTHILINAEVLDPHKILYTYEGNDHELIQFRTPGTFAGRVSALRNIGYDLSDDLYYGTRSLRNETAHGNQTIIMQHMQLSYASTMKAMLSMADALIELNMLDSDLRIPSFDLLRVREGDTLSGGAYSIREIIGEGGTSRVYRAIQTRIGRQIAIKELKPETWSDELIQNESSILLRLHHALVPQVYDIFFENATWYIAMSFIEGENLDSLIEREFNNQGIISSFDKRSSSTKVTLSYGEKLSLCRKLLDVLEYLHSSDNNIVFADLSPDNIIVDTEKQPHLIDFGISLPVNMRQKLPAATWGYSAPEIFVGKEIDQRADIYSFGFILRYIMTGLTPQMSTEVPTSHLIKDERISEVINRCTAKNPEERYFSIAELRQYLFPEAKNIAFLLFGSAIIISIMTAFVIYRSSPKTSSKLYDDLPAAEEVVDEPAAVEEELAAVEEEPAAEEAIEESTAGAKAASEGATDVDIDSIIAPMGYDNLMGREYTTNAHFFYPSGEYEYYSWLDAEFAPFEKGVLGYAVDDFDCDGQNEILLVTVEDTPIIAEPYDPENIERDYDVKKYQHDVRMKVLEYDESRITWKEASKKAIEMSDYGLYPVTGWFYKKFDDHVSIFFNRSGYLFDRGGHSSAVFCEYQYQDGTLEETEASHILQGFAETTEGLMRYFFMFPEEVQDAWDNYGFSMDLQSFSSLTGFYVPDFDQSCVKIAEITASSKVSIADMQGETSDQIIPDAVTYNITNVS